MDYVSNLAHFQTYVIFLNKNENKLKHVKGDKPHC